ncbi:unnamed protein product [Albugo candida]|uniref:Secreted protein n=1 Tax=Albugo candida TaxID=65357 RepID=A0A024FX56_9STRA|nr:unnamed protein product [Albugo candida]|eukprot:CCI11768.1 unnamed protein product [Albugo candida]
MLVLRIVLSVACIESYAESNRLLEDILWLMMNKDGFSVTAEQTHTKASHTTNIIEIIQRRKRSHRRLKLVKQSTRQNEIRFSH